MTSIKIKSLILPDGGVELRVLLQHPMENGRNREPLTGELIAAHFIENLSISLNGELLLNAELGGSVAKNPFFSFQIKQLNRGDRLEVIWQDNQGNNAHEAHVFADQSASVE